MRKPSAYCPMKRRIRLYSERIFATDNAVELLCGGVIAAFLFICIICFAAVWAEGDGLATAIVTVWR